MIKRIPLFCETVLVPLTGMVKFPIQKTAYFDGNRKKVILLDGDMMNLRCKNASFRKNVRLICIQHSVKDKGWYYPRLIVNGMLCQRVIFREGVHFAWVDDKEYNNPYRYLNGMNEIAFIYAGNLPDVIFKKLKRLLEKGVDVSEICWNVKVMIEPVFNPDNMESKTHIVRTPFSDEYIDSDFSIEQVDRVGMAFKRTIEKWNELMDSVSVMKLGGRDVTVVNTDKFIKFKKFLDSRKDELDKIL